MHRLVAAGEEVPIGTTVGLIAETREEYEALAGAQRRDQRGTATRSSATSATAAARPWRRRRAAVAAEGALDAVTRGPAGRRRAARPLVSPRARALAEGARLHARGRRAGSPAPGPAAASSTATSPRGPRRGHAAVADRRRAGSAALTVRATIPLRGRRGTIARRMVVEPPDRGPADLGARARREAARRAARRAERRRERAPRIGVTAIVVKLAAAALREHPLLNARVTETEIELLEEINVAVAVDTDEGLVAPVVAGADGSRSRRSTRASPSSPPAPATARSGPDDLAGGTFTVSNGGIHPVDITTAILNPPQAGILWIGRIRDRPVVVGDGAIAVRPTIQACLTFDHRAVDGARRPRSSPRSSRSSPTCPGSRHERPG